jgi:hypothetical protein
MRFLPRPSRGRSAYERWMREGDARVGIDLDSLEVVDESWLPEEPDTVVSFLAAEADHSTRAGTAELAERGVMSRVNLKAFPAEVLAALRWIERGVEVPAKPKEGTRHYFRCPSRSEVWRAVVRCGLRNLALPEVFTVDAMLRRGLFVLAISGFRFHFGKRGILDHAEARAQPYLPLGLVAEVEEVAAKCGLELSTALVALVVCGLSADRGGLANWSLGGPPWDFPARCRRATEDFLAALAEHHADLEALVRKAPGAEAMEPQSLGAGGASESVEGQSR